MRIRKHAKGKLSPLLYTTSSLKPGTVIQTHICQLNQSPWDVMSFSPPPSPPSPPSQVINGNDNIIVSAGSSSVQTIQVFEISSKGLKETSNKQQPRPLLIDQCIKSDGKSSWRCSKTAAKGNSLCEHHLSAALVKNNSNINNSNKSSNPRRSRNKLVSASSNPYEFYYYSGFGPQWDKKRSGETSRHEAHVSAGNNYYVEDDEHELSPIILSQLEHDQMDYTDEDEDDDDDDEEEENRRKKSRKPIKERSLKSLM